MTMPVRLASARKLKAMIPKPMPPARRIHAVGSLLPRVVAANRLTDSPSEAAPKMPTRLGQKAVRWLLHRRDRLPM